MRPVSLTGSRFGEAAPFLFDYEEHSRLGLSSDADLESYFCGSLINPSIPCRCFECDNEVKHQDRKLPRFYSVLRVGAYSLFRRDNPTERERNYENTITIKGEKYQHPGVSTDRLQSLGVKANVVSSYLQFLMVPNAKIHDISDSLINKKSHTGRATEHDVVEAEDSSDNEVLTSRRACNGPQRRSQGRVPAYRVSYTQEIAKVFPVSMKRIKALVALAQATQVYLRLEGATISLKVIDSPLHETPYFSTWTSIDSESRVVEGEYFPSISTMTLPRLNTLSCIAYFESGTLAMAPEEFEQTLAIASGNSIFVIGVILSDPFEIIPENAVKRIIGNIGRTGICLLVAPVNPKIRPLGEQYNLVNHAVYDGKREDNFRSTSLHLSFTDWTLPLEVKGSEPRTIDQEACLVEAVISVLDSGKWVADLDILCVDFNNLTRLVMTEQCPGHPQGNFDYDYTSIDSWEELLDAPPSVGIFRARGNWAARLAAVSILAQKDQGHGVGLFGPEDLCLDCMNVMSVAPWGLKNFESPLPSICID